MAKFEICYNYTRPFEVRKDGNGYNANLDGGTNWGVKLSVARAHGFKGNMEDLIESMAKEIGKISYFDPLNLYAVEQNIANHLYDHAYNCGTKTAAKLFQRAINDYYNKKTLKVDGRIGVLTIDAYLSISYKVTFLNIIRYFRQKYYRKIMFLKPWLRKYKNSWLRRV